MNPSHETTIDMTADLLGPPPVEECFEVDDIAALDPIEGSPAVAKNPSTPVTPGAATELEIELSADDMNALLDADPAVVDSVTLG